MRRRAAARASAALARLACARARSRCRSPLLDCLEPTPASCSSKIEPTFSDQAALSLDGALQLLQQSGHALPDRAAPTTRWLQAVIDGLCELSSRDPLTGLANRRHFELTLASEVDRVARAGEPALVLMIDIDHFKRVNDAHGHQAGDLVLKAVARGAQRVHPADGHGGALRRRGVRDDPAQLRALVRRRRSPSASAATSSARAIADRQRRARSR